MIQSAFNTNLPGTVIGGVPAMGLTGSRIIGGGIDVDPISPGLQSNPGVLTVTGPSRFISGNGFGGGMMTSGVGGIGFGGFGFGTAGIGVVDADPFTPGIQAQPGIVTPTGPPRIVGGPGLYASGLRASGVMVSGVRGQAIQNMGFSGVNSSAFAGGAFGGLPGGVIDADPITPGVQLRSGVVTPAGPPVVVGGLGAIGGALSGVLGGTTVLASRINRTNLIGVDADPISPGIQSGPGVITAVGPTKIIPGVVGNTVGYGSGIYGSRVVGFRPWGWCPWWLWVALILLLIGGLLGGLYAVHS